MTTSAALDGPCVARTTQRDRRSTVELDVDGTGRAEVSTGLPFFDHMLDQLGRHGGFDLTVAGRPATSQVDSHHTVEDVAITLGEALRDALGDKAGVRRFASGLFPLDEALVEVALDLSGRPFVVYDVAVPARCFRSATRRSTRSSPSTSSQSFATAAAITLHVHEASAAATPTTSSRRRSRASARCLRDAVRVEGDAIPSHEGRPL